VSALSDTATLVAPTSARRGARCGATGPATTLKTPQHIGCAPRNQERAMLHYAVVFFVIALIAALFGFTGIAAGAASIAQVLFVVFIVLAIASFVFSMFRKR
jgi:uncharacterized membrane protein YtjA (UPF0391 family)